MAFMFWHFCTIVFFGGSSDFLGQIYLSPILILFCKLAPICFHHLKTTSANQYICLQCRWVLATKFSYCLMFLHVSQYLVTGRINKKHLMPFITLYSHYSFISFVVQIKWFLHKAFPISSLALIAHPMVHPWTYILLCGSHFPLSHIIVTYRSIPVLVSNSFKGNAIPFYSFVYSPWT